ncbi:MAG: methyltransferase [Clostridiales bacterium]|nr:methyltransferase [Clostridiales bacterium]
MDKKISHYFIEDDTLAPHIETFSYYYKDMKFSLCSNSGIFSPGHVDSETDILIKSLPALSGKLLDLGCGYGVIGIVLGKYFGLDVTLADINQRALECAKTNCEKNDFSAEIIKTDCFENIKECFDAITLNPPIHAGKQVMFNMYEGAWRHLRPGGKFYVVIQKKHGAESTAKMLEKLFGNCESIYKKKGIFVFECAK